MHFFGLHILVLGRWTTRQLCTPFFQQYNVITVMKVQSTWKVIVSLRFRGNELKVLRKQQSHNMTGEKENPCYDIVVMAELPSSSLTAMPAPCLYLDQTSKMNETMNIHYPWRISAQNVCTWHWIKKGKLLRILHWKTTRNPKTLIYLKRRTSSPWLSFKLR